LKKQKTFIKIFFPRVLLNAKREKMRGDDKDGIDDQEIEATDDRLDPGYTHGILATGVHGHYRFLGSSDLLLDASDGCSASSRLGFSLLIPLHREGST